MYCPSCGEEVSGDSRYCSRCGESLDGGDRFRDTDTVDTTEDSGWGTEEGVGGGTDTVTSPGGDTTMAALTHVLALFTWVIGPLVVYIATEDEFVKENTRNAINWQIALTIYSIISFILLIVLVGFLTLALVGVLNFVFCIIAAVKASDGEVWEYPFTPDIL